MSKYIYVPSDTDCATCTRKLSVHEAKVKYARCRRCRRKKAKPLSRRPKYGTYNGDDYANHTIDTMNDELSS